MQAVTGIIGKGMFLENFYLSLDNIDFLVFMAAFSNLIYYVGKQDI